MICTYCKLDGADRPIAIVHSNSGPGWTQYAHARCAGSRSIEGTAELGLAPVRVRQTAALNRRQERAS